MKEKKKNHLFSWMIQFIKGMVIGSGAILPGVSGGALTAIFGLYEPIISFLADIKKNFLENILYFLPVGFGGIFGVFVLATPIDYALTNYPVHILWTFIGIITGTLPFLYKEAGKEGRKTKDILIVIFTAIFAFLFMLYGDKLIVANLSENLTAWILGGFIFAMGFMTPGLSSASFLIYLNLYQPLTEGIRTLDFSVIIPVGISGVFSILILSKLMRLLMDHAYATVFHLILGLVIASTLIIAPESSLYLGYDFFDYFIVFILFVIGLGLGYWMGQLEENITKNY
ncbi:MAG: DUF368 domain-containing protein [Atopostipes suicloacalis]|nr:DUF368 domain-containing protein [Atopostipes suicloacalis]